MNEEIGQAVFVININDTDALRQLSQWQNRLKSTMNEGQKDTESLASGFDKLQSSISQLATAGLAFVGLKSGISSVVDSYNEYEAALNGVKAVASATGNDISESLSSIKDLTSNGLISQAEAASAMKSLQRYGYSVQEATEMIKIMTDAAVYNRQAHYTVGEAVEATAQGIAQENSNLSDGVGITTNIAKMHENYARELGKTTAELTKAEKAQAVYNGYMKEGGIFAGNAEEYTNTLAGSQQKLNTAIQQVKQTMGAMVGQLTPVINGLADWISENQELVVWMGAFVGVIAGGSGLIAASKLAVTAIGGINTALTSLVGTSLLAKAAVLGLVGIIGGVLASALASGAADVMEHTSNAGLDMSDSLDDATGSVEALGSSSDSTAKKIAKLEQQLRDLDRDYERDLKQIAVKHEESLAKLTQQIEEANVDYRQAVEERNANFNVSLAKQEKSHQNMVDELMTQLSFLQRYNNDYNKQKLAQVQFALAKEQDLYQKQTAAQQAEIDLQNAADQAKYEQKLASLQAELDEEQAFYNKHRDELRSVQDVILLDEIESLNERYAAQRESYNQQITEAGVSGTAIGNTLGSNINKSLQEQLDSFNYQSSGQGLGSDFMTGILDGLKRGWNNVDNFLQQHFGAAWGVQLTKGGSRNSGGSGWAEGGYTGRGAVDEVAGVVHRGEYVLPASQVDQNTGTPKISGAQSITINLSGVLADSPQAKRQLASDIARALQQSQQSKLINQGSFV